MPIEAIIFDLDGTIIDTEMPDFLAWQERFAEAGLPLSIDLWHKRVGMVVLNTSADAAAGIFEPATYFAAQTGRTLSQQDLADLHSRYLALCASQPILPGVLEMLEAATAHGLPLGLASNSDRAWVEHWLGFHNLRRYFAHVYTRDDVANPKPAPDMYLATARALGVAPSKCVAFEDSPTGMTAALAAGMFCVGIPNGLTAHMPRPNVNLLLGSLAELSFADLLKAF
jgi:HAD superfamily hydrolase (TIGR01509 family)